MVTSNSEFILVLITITDVLKYAAGRSPHDFSFIITILTV